MFNPIASKLYQGQAGPQGAGCGAQYANGNAGNAGPQVD